MSTTPQKISFIISGIIPLLIGVVLIGTAGIKGFNGKGGEDTLLFQIITYANIPVILGGLLSILSAVRPNRLIALVAGVLMLLPSLFMTLINPVFSSPIVIFGILTVIISRRIAKKKP
jgi:hypothetical protein